MMYGFVKKVKMSRFTPTSHYSLVIPNVLLVNSKPILLHPILLPSLLLVPVPVRVFVIMRANIVVIKLVALILFPPAIVLNRLALVRVLRIAVEVLPVLVLLLVAEDRAVAEQAVVGSSDK